MPRGPLIPSYNSGNAKQDEGRDAGGWLLQCLAMKSIKFIGVSVAVAVGLGTVLAACGLPGGGAPTGLAESTATPDTGSSVSSQEASGQLANIAPGFDEVLRAVRAGDVESLLKLIDWSSATCGIDRGTTYCPGVADGQDQPVINVGADTFLVTAAGLTPSLELLLKGAPLLLTYASQAKDTPSRYYVGFEAALPRGRGIPPVTDRDLQLTGILLTLDATARHPIVAVNLGVNRESSVLDQAAQLGFETQRIITAVKPATGTPITATP